jgi:hypothetical protein
MRGADRTFLAQVRLLRRRERRRLLLQGVVQGTFFGAAAGAVLAVMAGTIRLPLPAAIAGLIAAAAGAAAGTLAGLLRRVDTGLLLQRADRNLGSRELAGTAWEIARRRAGHRGLFDDAIVADAARLLAASRPRDALGAPRLRLLPYIPAAVVLVAAASIFPFDLAPLFARRAAPERDMAVLGEELEGLGRRIEKSSRDLDRERGLELARELARLGRELQDRTVEPTETLERVEGLRQRLAQEYGLRMRRLPPGEARVPIDRGEGSGSGSGDGTGDIRESPPGGSADTGQPDAGGKADSPGELSAEKSAEKGGADSDRAGEDLADAMKKLDELKDRANRRAQADPGDAGGSSAEKKGSRGKRPGEGESDAPGGGAEGEGSSEPGDEPVADRPGAPSRIAGAERGAPLKAESTAEGAGEAMKFLVRSLPGWSAARTPEAKVLQEYNRQAESALAREEVPPELRSIVKDYFSAIGMAAGAP